MVEYEQEELICLYLDNHAYDPEQRALPADVTAAGIGNALELGESAASRIELLNTLSKLEDDGLVQSDERPVRGHDAPRTVYGLTESGSEFATDFRHSVGSTVVQITNGTTDEIPLNQIDQYLTESSAPIATALARLSEDGRVRLEQTDGDRFVDREETLEALREAITDSFTRDSRTVLVNGPAGIGKTALVEAAFKHIEEEYSDLITARGDCPPGPTTSYGPLRRAFETLPNGQALSDRLEEAQATPTTDDPDEVQNQREALFDDLADILRETSLSQPVVLFIDNLQWADKGSLELFEYLATSIDELVYPVAFIGTYRSPEVAAAESHPLAEAIDRMEQRDSFLEINVDPLERGDVRGLLTGVIGKKRLSEDFIDLVYEQTGGNPLFVRETASHLLEIGEVDPDEESFPRSETTVSLPEEISEQIDQRLSQLDGPSRELLELAAIIGEHIPLRVLIEAVELEPNRAQEYVDILIASHILEPGASGASADEEAGSGAELAADGSGNVRFVSGGVREAVIEKLLDEVAREHHSRVAEAFVSEYSDDQLDRWSARVAYHFDQAGAPTQAFDYFRRAGAYAASIYAHDQAIDHYRRAIELADELEQVPTEELASLWSELANVYKSKGDPDRVIESAQEGLSVALGDSQERCQLLGDLAWAEATRGHYEDAQTTASHQLELAKDLDARDQQAEALLMLGFTLVQTGDYGQAREQLEQSLEIHRDIGDRSGEAACLDTLGRLAMWQGELGSAREFCERGLDIVQDGDDRQKEAELLNILGTVSTKQNRIDEAWTHLEQSLEIHREIDNRVGESVALNNLGKLAMEQGKYEQASDYYEQTLGIKREIGAQQGKAVALVNLGHIALMRGRYDQARDRHERCLEITREIDHLRLEIENLRLLGQIAVETGNLEEAKEYLESSLDLVHDSGNRELKAKTLRTYGALAQRDGNQEEATEYLTQARDILERLDDRAGLARTRLLLADVALAEGDIETGRDHGRAALEIFEELNQVHWIGRSHHVLGAVSAQSGAQAAAHEHWNAALDIFEDIGAPQDSLQTLQSFIESCRTGNQLDDAKRLCQSAEKVLTTAPETTAQIYANWLRNCTAELNDQAGDEG